MTEFENIFEEANKKNGKEAPPPKAAPAATEKKSFAEVQREKRAKCYEKATSIFSRGSTPRQRQLSPRLTLLVKLG